MLTVGQIVKPQGIRGEVKVKTSDPSRFCVLKSVEVNGKPYRITGARVSGADAFIKLEGVDDRNAAEALRGAMLKIDRAAAAPLDAGEFYVADLIGAQLVARDGEVTEKVGTITKVDSFGAADVFTVEGEKSLSFPFLKALNPEFSESEKTLYVDKKKLSEVSVYEN
ncbi:MAG: 16S rRNA processing protein RimM [Clostridiales bacterium]|nr:16S rRNA processing protein RimM [Clostridiales bacterium]